MNQRIALVVTLCIVASLPCRAGASAGHYEDPAYSFSMAIPSLGESNDALVIQRFAVAGPVQDDFAPNCNVQVQFLATDLDGFMDLTLRQFNAAGLKVVRRDSRRVSDLPAATFEYMGPLNSRDLRFLALVVSGSDRFWLLTCTGLSSTFEQHRAAFTLAIDSFRVTSPRKSH